MMADVGAHYTLFLAASFSETAPCIRRALLQPNRQVIPVPANERMLKGDGARFVQAAN
jgi:hypothetical protein